jgi:hypothetical protein
MGIVEVDMKGNVRFSRQMMFQGKQGVYTRR